MGSFQFGQNAYVCRQCGRRYFLREGILDCLGDQQPSQGAGPSEWELGTSFAEPVRDDEEVRQLSVRLHPLYERKPGSNSSEPSMFLDAGCGFGGLLAAAAPHFELIVGVNTALDELAQCAELLAKRKVEHVVLVRASALHLPFAPSQFLAVSCVQVLEHVSDPTQLLKQIHETLIPGGNLFLSVPNRFSIRAEPHTGLLWMGFFPEAAAEWYAALRNKRELLQGVRMISVGQLTAWLQAEYGDHFKFIRSGYHHSTLAKAARIVWSIPILSHLARQLVGDIEVLAWR